MSLTLQDVADGILAAVGGERSALVLSEDDGRTINFVAAAGPGAEALAGQRGPAAGSGLCGSVLAGSCSVLAPETLGDPRVHQGHAVELSIATALGVPVYHEGDAIAVLMALNKADGSRFDERDEAALTAYAEEVAPAVAERVR